MYNTSPITVDSEVEAGGAGDSAIDSTDTNAGSEAEKHATVIRIGRLRI